MLIGGGILAGIIIIVFLVICCCLLCWCRRKNEEGDREKQRSSLKSKHSSVNVSNEEKDPLISRTPQTDKKREELSRVHLIFNCNTQKYNLGRRNPESINLNI